MAHGPLEPPSHRCGGSILPWDLQVCLASRFLPGLEVVRAAAVAVAAQGRITSLWGLCSQKNTVQLSECSSRGRRAVGESRPPSAGAVEAGSWGALAACTLLL